MPVKPKKPCAHTGCPGLTYTCYCDAHKKEADRSYNKHDRDSAARKHYGRTWEKVRALYLSQYPLCAECQKAGRLTPALEVHHIIPLSKGGTHDSRNLMALCVSCHSRTTARDGGRWG